MSIPFLGSVLAFAQVVMAQYEGEEVHSRQAPRLREAVSNLVSFTFFVAILFLFGRSQVPQGDAGQLPGAGKLDVVIPTPILVHSLSNLSRRALACVV